MRTRASDVHLGFFADPLSFTSSKWSRVRFIELDASEGQNQVQVPPPERTCQDALTLRVRCHADTPRGQQVSYTARSSLIGGNQMFTQCVVYAHDVAGDKLRHGREMRRVVACSCFLVIATLLGSKQDKININALLFLPAINAAFLPPAVIASSRSRRQSRLAGPRNIQKR